MKGIDLDKLQHDSKLTNKVIDKTFEDKKIEREIGLLGIIFGSGDTVKMNIAGSTILILVLFGIIITFCCLDDLDKVVKIWGITVPIITLALGYIFGKSSK